MQFLLLFFTLVVLCFAAKKDGKESKQPHYVKRLRKKAQKQKPKGTPKHPHSKGKWNGFYAPRRLLFDLGVDDELLLDELFGKEDEEPSLFLDYDYISSSSSKMSESLEDFDDSIIDAIFGHARDMSK